MFDDAIYSWNITNQNKLGNLTSLYMGTSYEVVLNNDPK